MKKFDQQKFNEFIIQNGVVGFFKEPIELNSGRLSPYYVNWRYIAEDVYLLDILTDHIIAFIEHLNLNPDCFYGVPEGATKLGIITQYKWARMQTDYGPGRYALPMGRGRPKDHGDPKDRYYVGAPSGRTVILEDVTTTGESLLSTIDSMLEFDIPVIAAVGLTNRNELRDDGKTVKEAVEEKGVPYYAMSNALELLPEVYKLLRPGDDIARLVEEYFEKYGVEKIKLR